MDKKQNNNTSHKEKVSNIIVDKNSGLLEFLLEKLDGKSRTTVKSYLAHQQVLVNNKVVRQFDYELKKGDAISIYLRRGKSTLNERDLKITYEDRDIIVVEKNAGLQTIDTGGAKTRTAYGILTNYVKKINKKNAVYPVNKLDKNTSGFVVFTKNSEMQVSMLKNWRYFVTMKNYYVVVEGHMETGDNTGTGVIKSYLWESKAHIVYSSSDPDKGILAVTRYKILKANNKYSLLDIQIETTQKNQIRAQLKGIGHPVLGDVKYEGMPSPAKRMMMHAYKVSFKHPSTDEDMCFETPVPENFSRLIK